jgi:toxin ParE1/3/4
MGSYALTVEADEDIQGIAEYSLQQWGLARAETYILGLHEAFRRLADFPDMGRDASHIRAGYWRMDSLSHAVFYTKSDAGVLIVRVLHQRMDFGRHLR